MWLNIRTFSTNQILPKAARPTEQQRGNQKATWTGHLAFLIWLMGLTAAANHKPQTIVVK